MAHTKQPSVRKFKGFTLIELIVVITILVILGTIGFLSIGGYSSKARDSARIGDAAQISKSLDLSIVTAGSYPMPDNAFSVTYSGGVVWNQGTIGSTVMQVFKSSISGGGLNEKPIDPLTNKEYTYSELAEGNAYQIKVDYEGDLNQTALDTSLIHTSLVDSAQAAPGDPTIAYIRGNFGGLTAKVSTGGILYVLAVPSIITSTGTTTGGSLTTNSLSGTLLFNGRNLRNASTFNPSTLVHSGARNAVNPSGLPDTSTGILNMMSILKSTYAVSDIQSNQNIANLISTSTGGLTVLGTSIINAQLGGSAVSTGGGGGTNTTVSGTCSGLPSNAVYFNNTTSYSISSAPSGTSLTASGVTVPVANTCQFSCSNGFFLNNSTNTCESNFIANGAGSLTMRQRVVTNEGDGWALCGDSAIGNLTSWQTSPNCTSKTGKVILLFVPQAFSQGIGLVYNRSDYKQCSANWGTYYYGDNSADDITGTADGYGCSTGSYGLFASSVSTDGCGFGPCGTFNASGSWTEGSGWTGGFTRRGGGTLNGYDYGSWGCNNSTGNSCSTSYTIVRTQIWRK